MKAYVEASRHDWVSRKTMLLLIALPHIRPWLGIADPRLSKVRLWCPEEASTSGDDMALIAESLEWIDRFVIGHSLCPFAKPVRPHIRWVVERGNEDAAAATIVQEASALHGVDTSCEATTLILLPGMSFRQFAALMTFLPEAQRLADETASGAIQVIPFHPLARYGDSPMDAADCSTQSPVSTGAPTFVRKTSI